MPLKTRHFSNPTDLVAFVNDAQEVTVAAIVGAGTLYTALDVLTVVGGVFKQPTKIRVDTVGGGGNITGVTVIGAGEYLTVPGDPVSVTGGTGSAATFNLTAVALLVQADIVKITPRDGNWFLNYWV